MRTSVRRQVVGLGTPVLWKVNSLKECKFYMPLIYPMQMMMELMITDGWMAWEGRARRCRGGWWTRPWRPLQQVLSLDLGPTTGDITVAPAVSGRPSPAPRSVSGGRPSLLFPGWHDINRFPWGCFQSQFSRQRTRKIFIFSVLRFSLLLLMGNSARQRLWWPL